MLDFDARLTRGRFALDARFTADAGVTALFGRSGAGKSTIVAAIAGLARPDSGRIALDGHVLYDARERIDVAVHRRRVGVVFQEPRLFPHRSVRANLLYGASAGARVDETAELLGLEDLLDRRPATLSGGEAQRVAIGRALLARPGILLMDEPLSSLDGARKARILPYLERLAAETAVPILYVSHALGEVARLAERLVVLSHGRVEAQGPIGEVMARVDLGPATGRYEASSVLDGVLREQDRLFDLSLVAVEGERLAVPRLELPLGSPVRLRVRARDVALALERPAGLSIRNVLPVVVEAVTEEEGAFAEARLSLGPQSLRARLTRRSLHELGLAPGAHAFALIKSVAVDTPRAGRV